MKINMKKNIVISVLSTILLVVTYNYIILDIKMRRYDNFFEGLRNTKNHEGKVDCVKDKPIKYFIDNSLQVDEIALRRLEVGLICTDTNSLNPIKYRFIITEPSKNPIGPYQWILSGLIISSQDKKNEN